MKPKIIVFGAGGHSKVIIDIIEKENKYEITGIIDNNKNLWHSKLLDYPVIGGDDKLKEIISSYPEIKAIIGIGNNKDREKINNIILSLNIQLAKAIHPSAQIARNVNIGNGTVIMANVAINTDTNIGINCIINTGTTLDHDNTIEDYVHISPGSHIAGNVTIGKYTHIGTGVSITPGKKIGFNSIVGAGSTVIKDLPDNVVAVGVPAKVIKFLD